jgi:RNA polymerase sigma-70 factor (ECF subfamily)
MLDQSKEEYEPFSDAELRTVLPHLHAYAKFKLRSDHEAEDLVQEAIEKAWRSRDGFDGRSTLKAWLVTILRNGIIDHVRKRLSVTKNMERRPTEISITFPDQVVRLELADYVKSLDALHPDTREAIILVSAGLTHEEAAEVMNSPLGTLKSKVRRGRQQLTLLYAKTLPSR